MANKTNDIKLDQRNYRNHPDKNKRIISKSLKELGAGRSILIDAENEIIAGNGVYEQAKKQNIPIRIIETDGTELVVVKRNDLKTGDEKRKQLALVDNQANDLSEFDNDLITSDFDKNFLEDWGYNDTGYFQKDQKVKRQEFIEEKIPYPITIVVSKEDYDKWIEIKRQFSEENDLKAFLKVMKSL